MLQYDLTAPATRPSDLKVNNRMQILELFKSGAVMSVAEIARSVSISRQTVMKAIQFFMDKGIIVSMGKAHSGSAGGKRAELFALNPDRMMINIVICPSCLYVSLFNYQGTVVADYTDEAVVSASQEAIMEAAISACDRLLSDQGVRSENLRGISLTSPGIFEPDSDRMRYNIFYPGWGSGVPLGQKLREHFGEAIPIIARNVTRLCGSVYSKDSYGHSRVATVFTRWGGISSCMLIDGYVLAGKDNLIGAIGHIILDPNDPEVCGCGCRGCFEKQVSIERLRTIANRWAPDYPGSILLRMGLECMTIQSLFESSEQGDALARRLSGYAATCFVSALRSVTLTFNPSRVILQGDYAFVDSHFKAVLFRELRKFRYYDERQGDAYPFQLETDRRSVKELSNLGAYTLLINRIFGDEAVYS